MPTIRYEEDTIMWSACLLLASSPNEQVRSDHGAKFPIDMGVSTSLSTLYWVAHTGHPKQPPRSLQGHVVVTFFPIVIL